MRILFFDTRATLNNTEKYSYYSGTFKELNTICQVDLVRSPVLEMPGDISEKYDAIIFGLGWFSNENEIYYRKIKGLDEVRIPVICNLHKVANQTKQKINFLRQNNIDMTFMSPGFINRFQSSFKDLNFRLLPFAANQSVFYPSSQEKQIQIGFSGALHSVDKNKKIKNGFTEQKAMLRQNMFDIIKKQFQNTNSFINTGVSNKLLPEQEYANILRNTLIWFATDSPAEEISPRHFEVMLSKTALMCNKIPKAYDNIFIDGENCIEFDDDLNNFESKLSYYLNNQEETLKIIEKAYQDAKSNHTWKHRARNIVDHINILRGGACI